MTKNHCSKIETFGMDERKQSARYNLCFDWLIIGSLNKTMEKKMDREKHRGDNSVYVAIAGEVVNRRSVLLKNIVLN